MGGGELGENRQGNCAGTAAEIEDVACGCDGMGAGAHFDEFAGGGETYCADDRLVGCGRVVPCCFGGLCHFRIGVEKSSYALI